MIDKKTIEEGLQHKYKMGIIGNCNFLALIGDTANIEWLCWPQFDSSFVFGNLLDDNKGGDFYIRPDSEDFISSQQYIENTNVLETYFETKNGKFKVVDFAPRIFQNDRYYKPLMLVRKIVPLEGMPVVKVKCQPKYNYGQRNLDSVLGSNHITYKGADQDIRLTTAIPLHYIESETSFVLKETEHIVLTYGEPMEAALASTAERFLQSTIEYWKAWIKRSALPSFKQSSVIRSILTLKLHQYEETGAIIAAATTSLPEHPGSGRNWDYRYCWIRDTHYTLKALNDTGHFTELERHSHFIENIVLLNQNFQPLHPIAPGTSMKEEIHDLKGYDGAGKVRIGNQASEHNQYDVYGQVLTTLLPLFIDKRLTSNERSYYRQWILSTLDKIEATLDEPDNGIWEFRNRKQKHCYTFLFHWAGSCAAKKIGQVIGDEVIIEKANHLIAESSKHIETCYIPEKKGYAQAMENDFADASLLQLINMRYLDPSSERAKDHLAFLEKELHAKDGLFYRYLHTDDFGKPSSTFLICGFWYVEALARVGRIEEAKTYFSKLTNHSNHLGLFSEDVTAKEGSQWGNFPQTYSHVGQINAAFAINTKLDLPNYLDF